MRKLLVVAAFITALSSFVIGVHATVPVVSDLPDIAFGIGQSVSDLYDLDEYVDDFDTADSALGWTVTGTAPQAVSVDTASRIATTSGSMTVAVGTANLQASDGAGTDSQDSTIKYSSFLLTQPSLTKDGFVSPVSSGDLLSTYVTYGSLSGSAIITSNLLDHVAFSPAGSVSFEVYARAAFVNDGTSTQANRGAGTLVPALSSFGGLQVAISASGALTLTPLTGFTETVELGVKAIVGANDYATARLWVAPDIAPTQQTAAVETSRAHAFEGVGTIPTGFSASDTEGFYIEDFSSNPNLTLQTFAAGTPTGAPVANIAGGPSGDALIVTQPAVTGNIGLGRVWFNSVPIEAGQEYEASFWMASDVADVSDYEIWFVPVGLAGEAWNQVFLYTSGTTTGVPTNGSGWKKITTRFNGGTLNTNMNVVIQLVGHTSITSTATFWIDNFAIVEVPQMVAEWNSPDLSETAQSLLKAPVDLTNVSEDCEGATLADIGIDSLDADLEAWTPITSVAATANHTNATGTDSAIQFAFTSSTSSQGNRIRDSLAGTLGSANVSGGPGVYELSCWVKNMLTDGFLIVAGQAYSGSANPDITAYVHRDAALYTSTNSEWTKVSVYIPVSGNLQNLDVVIQAANRSLSNPGTFASGNLFIDDLSLSKVDDSSMYWDASIFPTY